MGRLTLVRGLRTIQLSDNETTHTKRLDTMKTTKGTHTITQAVDALSNGHDVYLDTYTGLHKVESTDGVSKVYTPDANAGFGRTWHTSGKSFVIDYNA